MVQSRVSARSRQNADGDAIRAGGAEAAGFGHLTGFGHTLTRARARRRGPVNGPLRTRRAPAARAHPKMGWRRPQTGMRTAWRTGSRLVTRARGGDAAVGSSLRLQFQIITNWN